MEKSYNYEELYHWGIKGMKWGVRRYQNNDGTLTSEGKKRKQSKIDKIDKKAKRENWSDDAKTAAEIKTKNVKQMSNAELRKINERIQLEKQYSQLTKKETSKGRKLVNELVGGAAKDTAKNYISKYMKKGIDSGITYISSLKTKDN